MFRAFIGLLLIIAYSCASAETLLLSAEAGKFQANPIGEPANTVNISTSFKLTDFDGSAGWPPAAYVGFFQGPDRNESFQFLIIRNGGNAPFLTVGYRVIEDGKQKSVASLANIPLDSSASVKLTFNKGIVTVNYGDQAPIMVKTKLIKVAPYVSVSSGTAEYEMRP